MLSSMCDFLSLVAMVADRPEKAIRTLVPHSFSFVCPPRRPVEIMGVDGNGEVCICIFSYKGKQKGLYITVHD